MVIYVCQCPANVSKVHLPVRRFLKHPPCLQIYMDLPFNDSAEVLPIVLLTIPIQKIIARIICMLFVVPVIQGALPSRILNRKMQKKRSHTHTNRPLWGYCLLFIFIIMYGELPLERVCFSTVVLLLGLNLKRNFVQRFYFARLYIVLCYLVVKCAGMIFMRES